MRDLESRLIRNPPDYSVKNMKSFHALTLIASLKQKLQSQTDTKKRSFLFRHFADYLVQLIFFQLSHRISEGSNARKNYFICLFNLMKISRDNTFLSKKMKRFLHTL